MYKIWVDADACPKPIKEILLRVATKRNVTTTFVANQFLRLPSHPNIEMIQASTDFDAADDEIAARCQKGELVITADIPLAARIVEKGAKALNPRGQLYDANNIRQALSLRNFMDELRSGGVETGGPKSFDKRDIQAFANQLDRLITSPA